MNKFNLKIITLFGIGYLSKAPGTWASFATCIFYSILIINEVNFALPVILFFFLLIYSIPLIDKNSSSFKEKDSKEIVIDEFLGQSVPILLGYYFIFRDLHDFVSCCRRGYGGRGEDLFVLMIVSFLAFRLFDITKPFPINLIDKKMKNGLGVVLDDILAGFYAYLFLLILTELI
tara:strand:- start:52 stop:576 length:525 start_codon:yes stop_codon:yes gene_type:complete